MDLNTLFRQLREGKEYSEEELFQALSVRFQLFVSRRVWNEEDGKEIVQDALMTIYSLYKTIDFNISFSAWSYKVLENRILDYYKKRKRRGASFAANSDPETAYSEWAQDPLFEQQLLDCLQQIGKINKMFARVLNFKFQGYDVEEICRKLEISAEYLYVIVSRARSMLQKCLDQGL